MFLGFAWFPHRPHPKLDGGISSVMDLHAKLSPRQTGIGMEKYRMLHHREVACILYHPDAL
jgi:hypothetical protein